MEDKKQEKKILNHKILTIVGIVICALLLPILIINITMIINSYVNKDEAPNFGKYVPFIVQSGSMSGVIESGDIIITVTVEPEDVEKGDIIAFYNPKGNGSSVVTHRVLFITENDKGLLFTTIGDVVYNETVAEYGSFEAIPENVLKAIVEEVPEDKLISVYKSRIPVIGHISLFMSTIPGFIVCVLCPLLLFVGYDVYRRKINEKSNKKDMDLLLAELEMLIAQKDSKEEKNEQ